MTRTSDDTSAADAMVALRRLVRYLRLAERDVEAAIGISVAQLFVLHHLSETPQLSLAELAERTLTDPSSVSTVVARLVDQGFVLRKPSRTDRRRAALSISATGKKLVAAAPRIPQLAVIAAIEKMSPKRRAELVRSLQGLVAAVHAGGLAPKMLFDDEKPGRIRS